MKFKPSLSAAVLLTGAMLTLSQSQVCAEENKQANPAEATTSQPATSGTTTPPSVEKKESDESIDKPQAADSEKNNEPEVEKATGESTDKSSIDNEIKANIAPVSEKIDKKKANTIVRPVIAIQNDTLYMAESQRGDLKLNKKITSLEDVEISFGGKKTDEWKQWNIKSGAFDGGNVFNVEKKDTETINFEMKPMFGITDLSQRWPHNLRRLYTDYINDFELVVKDKKDGTVLYKKVYHLRPYEHFHTYDEMVKKTEEITKNAKKDRYVALEEYGRSLQNRPQRLGIVAKNKEDVENYLKNFTPEMLNHPLDVLKKIKAGQLNYKVPIFINNTHADEQPAIDIVVGLYEKFATADNITFKTTDDAGNLVERAYKAQDALDKFFFLFSFVENPDGRYHNERSNANGFDVNRDHGYQTQAEAKNMVAQISKYNPLTFLDFHGFQKQFLIEPCTAPHDPNFEYDLMVHNMLEHAHAMGRAGVANSLYNAYMTPREDWPSGWDDDFSGYTAVYSVYHHVMGHTIEIPEGNEESYKAGLYAGLGGIYYALTNRDRLMEAKLLAMQRGVLGIEDPKTEKEFVGPDGKVVGRPKLNNGKFFPNYYVIPMQPALQKDPNEAFEMIAYFKRNGVVVKQLKKDIKGTNFKKGDLIIDMAQAKRGVANMALWRGSDDSAWDSMYAEVVVNFPLMRGFDIQRVNKPEFFKGYLTDVTWEKAPRDIPAVAPFYFVENNSIYAVKAVNKALEQGLPVYLTKGGYYFSAKTLKAVFDDYALKAKAFYGTTIANRLMTKKIFAPGQPNLHLGYNSPSRSSRALKEMGFTLVDNFEDADLVIADDEQLNPEWIGKKPMILLGGEAIVKAIENGKLPGIYLRNTDDRHEGLLKALLDTKNPLTSGYTEDGYFYTTSGAWLINDNKDFHSVLKLKGEGAYLAGWWPGHEKAYNQSVVLEGKINGMPTLIYAGTPLNKMHTHAFYRLISNAIYHYTLKEADKNKVIESLKTDSDNSENDILNPSVDQSTDNGEIKNDDPTTTGKKKNELDQELGKTSDQELNKTSDQELGKTSDQEGIGIEGEVLAVVPLSHGKLPQTGDKQIGAIYLLVLTTGVLLLSVNKKKEE